MFCQGALRRTVAQSWAAWSALACSLPKPYQSRALCERPKTHRGTLKAPVKAPTGGEEVAGQDTVKAPTGGGEAAGQDTVKAPAGGEEVAGQDTVKAPTGGEEVAGHDTVKAV
eukprot:363366-Chlamydomonas_euryale.AAC.3